MSQLISSTPLTFQKKIRLSVDMIYNQLYYGDMDVEEAINEFEILIYEMIEECDKLVVENTSLRAKVSRLED